MAGKKVPLGIELVKRKVATEADVKEAIRYQKEHPEVTSYENHYDIKLWVKKL